MLGGELCATGPSFCVTRILQWLTKRAARHRLLVSAGRRAVAWTCTTHEPPQFSARRCMRTVIAAGLQFDSTSSAVSCFGPPLTRDYSRGRIAGLSSAIGIDECCRPLGTLCMVLILQKQLRLLALHPLADAGSRDLTPVVTSVAGTEQLVYSTIWPSCTGQCTTVGDIASSILLSCCTAHLLSSDSGNLNVCMHHLLQKDAKTTCSCTTAKQRYSAALV